MAEVYVEAGKRDGRTLQNERAMLAKLGEGHRVFTTKNGVWFEATLEGGRIAYTALTQRPESMPALQP